MYVAKCHACHEKCRGATGDQRRPSAHQSQPSVISAATATQMLRPCRQMPRLPRKCYVHVTKCHACHAKSRWMSPNATLARAKCRGDTGDQRRPTRHQSQQSVIATPATHMLRPCRQVPRLLAKCRGATGEQRRPSARQPAQCHNCRACHANATSMSPGATPAKCHACQAKYVHVAKCHACHAKCRGATGDQGAPSAPPEPAYVISATPATQMIGPCRQVPCLPRKVQFVLHSPRMQKGQKVASLFFSTMRCSFHIAPLKKK